MKNKKGTLLITLGLLLIAAALGLTCWNLYEAYTAAQSAQQVVSQLEEFLPAETPGLSEDSPAITEAPDILELEVPDYILDPNREMPVETINGKDYIGVLEIPAYHLELPVISEWSYPNLKIAPCRYEGSVYTGDLIIAAHNYNKHFGNLKNLAEGDAVIFTDMDGNVFSYEVAVRETLMPTAVEEMTSGEWDLTLFTCTVGGSYRVTVRCERAE